MFGKKKKKPEPQKKQVPRLPFAEKDAISSLIREIVQYRQCPQETPSRIINRIVQKIDKSYTPVQLRDIGGEGAVIRVTNPAGQHIALKVALPYQQAAGKRDIAYWTKVKFHYQKATDNTYQKRFLEGARIQTAICNTLRKERQPSFYVPNVLCVSQSPCLYMEMEWIESPCILDWLKDKNSLRYSLTMFDRLLCAVAFLHERGIIHRDLKATNIMIEAPDTPVIIDWTLARERGIKRNITMPGTAMGTKGHASPKMYISRRPDLATDVDDIYSLAFVLVEFVLRKELPQLLEEKDFEDESKLEQYRQTMAQSLPNVLKPVFFKASELKEEHRYQLVEEFRFDFRAAMQKIDFNEPDVVIFENEARAKTAVNEILKEFRQRTDIDEEAFHAFLEEFVEGICSGCNPQYCYGSYICFVLLQKTAQFIAELKERKFI